MMGEAEAGTAPATGEGIIEGTEVKEGADNAAGESRTEGEVKLAPTDINGNEIWLELAGSTAFI